MPGKEGVKNNIIPPLIVCLYRLCLRCLRLFLSLSLSLSLSLYRSLYLFLFLSVDSISFSVSKVSVSFCLYRLRGARAGGPCDLVEAPFTASHISHKHFSLDCVGENDKPLC